jgi:ATP-dependent exoDNAse (exonuclease V) alpha subunit
MLYTAVTRASKSVILLGDPAYFRDMARNASASKRLTSLDEMLKELDLGQALSI